MEAALCETCFERGRERPADVVMENLAMCYECYGGKPTCIAETVGGADDVRTAAKRRYELSRKAGLPSRAYRRKTRESRI